MLGWLPSWNIGADPDTKVESRTAGHDSAASRRLLVRVKEKRKDFAKLLKPGGGQVPEANANDPQELKDALNLLKEYQQATKEAKQQALKKLGGGERPSHPAPSCTSSPRTASV